MSVPTLGKALFCLGLPPGPCPVDWAAWWAAQSMVDTSCNTAQLKGDALPFNLCIPFTAAGNRDFYVTWRAEGESVCCF